MTRFLGAGDIRRLASDLGVAPTKKWGQNFVIDPNTVRRIVEDARINSDDVVVEVGPGLGSLTLGLLDVAQHVIAVEIDERLANRLPDTVSQFAPELLPKLTVLQQDALLVNALPLQPTKLVANLPYNVSVPVLLHFLENFPSVQEVLVMVQAEVGERLAAPPGSKIYGVPSVKAAWYGHVTKVATISRQIFWPVPNVDSVLVRIVRHEQANDSTNRHQVFAVIDAAFGQRRKTLRSALSALFGDTTQTSEILGIAGVDSGLRGEQLDLAAFIRIAQAAKQVK
jgi:16S rRNA (adenine1518-N6/adenine1519-N6)-dimethyltransferase